MSESVMDNAITSWTLEEFVHGTPERLIQATEHPKVLVVYPHGDETLGAKIGHHLATERRDLLSNVDYVCGNPIAAAAETRSTQKGKKFPHPVEGFEAEGTDLNRSFFDMTPEKETSPKSYERTRAEEIMRLIEEGDYDYILDMHTSKSDVGRIMIVYERFMQSPAVRRMIAASPVGNIAIWPERVAISGTEDSMPLATDGLIGHYSNSISFEYSRPVANEIGVAETIDMIEGLISGEPRHANSPRRMFQVTHTVPKGDYQDHITNLTYNTTFEGWPVVCSRESDYNGDDTKPYTGFLATNHWVEPI